MWFQNRLEAWKDRNSLEGELDLCATSIVAGGKKILQSKKDHFLQRERGQGKISFSVASVLASGKNSRRSSKIKSAAPSLTATTSRRSY